MIQKTINKTLVLMLWIGLFAMSGFYLYAALNFFRHNIDFMPIAGVLLYIALPVLLAALPIGLAISSPLNIVHIYISASVFWFFFVIAGALEGATASVHDIALSLPPIFWMLPFAVIATYAIAIMIFPKSSILDYHETYTYEWYRKEHPENFKNNRITCYVCGNNRIHVRALMNHTYTREHFCTQCGKTLYYSPENN